MKRETGKWVRKAEEDWRGAQALSEREELLRDLVCFHCQQSAEKYLKGLLQDYGVVAPRTHDLEDLLDLLLPLDPTLAPLRRPLSSLTRFAVDYRYPDWRTTLRQMKSALRNTGRVRRELRTRLGLPE
jgi:HEPN domain-containing protein